MLTQTEAWARTAGLDVTRVAPGNDVDVMDDLDRLLRTEPPDRAPRTRLWALGVATSRARRARARG